MFWKKHIRQASSHNLYCNKTKIKKSIALVSDYLKKEIEHEQLSEFSTNQNKEQNKRNPL